MAAELESLCNEARQLFRHGKYAESIRIFGQVLGVDPDRADVHEAIATAHFLLKQYDQAVEHFTRVTQLRPMDCKGYINLGAVFNRKEEFQKAADILKKAISRDGKAVEAYYNLGIAYRGLHQPAMAVNSYKEALRINPHMLDAMQNLGNVYLEMHNSKAAIEQYKKALEINPEFERAQRGLARAEEVEKQSRENVNPFGRLVDQKTTKQMKPDVRLKRLSPEERIADRQSVRRMIIQMQAVSQQIFEHLRDVLEDDLMQLNRGVQMSQKEVHKSVFAAKDKFQSAVQKFRNLRNELQQATKELNEHEAALKEGT